MASAGGGQRGPLSDPRHGRARGEVISGAQKSRLWHQVRLVAIFLAVAVLAAAVAMVLLTDFGDSRPWLRTVAWLVIASAVAVIALFAIRRRGRRGALPRLPSDPD